jgi:ABC-type phosphate transport system auxiliary subunit
MPLDKSRLFEFLGVLDNEMSREITVVAVGGTAMTLLDLKPSTRDIDFTAPGKDFDEFERVLKSVPHGFEVQGWRDGTVFSQTLPEDYLEKSKPIADFKHIHLKALHPVDIVVTKIGRLNQRDLQDIEVCIEKFKLSKTQVKERANQVQYVGREEHYKYNLQYVLKKFF